MHEVRKFIFDAKENQDPNTSVSCFCTLCHFGRNLSLSRDVVVSQKELLSLGSLTRHLHHDCIS